MKTQYAKVQTLVTALNTLSAKSLHSAIEEIVPQLTQEVNTLGKFVDEASDALVRADDALKDLSSKLHDADEKAKLKAKGVAKELCKGEPLKLDSTSNPVGEPEAGVIEEAPAIEGAPVVEVK